ncbi:MAG: sel1 repeat family protein [Muribaculaceae bacterium]|nr:sel1 repeat family protein [Muribaculaceae bacterium]
MKSILNIIRAVVMLLMLSGTFALPVSVMAEYTYTDFQKWNKKAEAGDPVAMRHVGVSYYYGSAVKRDYGLALKWLRKGADAGDSESMRYVGKIYWGGLGVDRNFSQAMYWYKKASVAGDAESTMYIGNMLYNGEGVTKNHNEAFKWYKKAADEGNAAAMRIVGVMYHNGEGTPRDYNAAGYWYERAAAAGDTKAREYLEKNDKVQVAQNTNKKVTLQSGKKQRARSLATRGGTCGNASPKRTKLTADQQKFQDAMNEAERGDAKAICTVGYYYDTGTGVGQDYREAMKWYKRASELGNGIASNNIGVLYEYGSGVSTDLSKAKYWYEKAIVQGGTSNARGNFDRVVAELARRSYGQREAENDYVNGKALSSKYKLSDALPLLTRAAEWGHKEAMFELALLYVRKSHGSEYDDLIAKWLISAAEVGNVKCYKYAGMIYENGFGCMKNFYKAQAWYQKGLFSNVEPERILCDGYLRFLQNGWGNRFNRYTIMPVDSKDVQYSHSSGSTVTQKRPAKETREVPCTWCNATGLVIPVYNRLCGPSENCYDIDCKVCGKRHCHHINRHELCPKCNGKGKRRQVKTNGSWYYDINQD